VYIISIYNQRNTDLVLASMTGVNLYFESNH